MNILDTLIVHVACSTGTCTCNMHCTCGMMVILDLRSSKPNTEMLILSMKIEPPADSMIRNRARVSDDLPAPVRPTIPTYTIDKQVELNLRRCLNQKATQMFTAQMYAACVCVHYT